jgi:hypothetical protein
VASAQQTGLLLGGHGFATGALHCSLLLRGRAGGIASSQGGLVSEVTAARKDKARPTGAADHIVDPAQEDLVARAQELTAGVGADVGFKCSSVNSALDQLLAAVRWRATRRGSCWMSQPELTCWSSVTAVTAGSSRHCSAQSASNACIMRSALSW